MVNRLRKSYVGTKRSTCGSDRGEKHERDRPSWQIQQYCIMGSNPIFSVGGVVQLVERMFCKHEAVGSTPIVSKQVIYYEKAV
jgi:hypothetical protein